MAQPTSSTTQVSAIRQNYSLACESAINKQINMELKASYVYMSMAYHFDRDDIALKGCYEYFKNQSDEERGHAMKLMEYQNLRGGRIVFQDVKCPAVAWNSHTQALEEALALERSVNDSILALHKTARDNSDPHLYHYLNVNFVREQVDSISEISKLLTNAKRCGDGLGIYQFDRNSMASA